MYLLTYLLPAQLTHTFSWRGLSGLSFQELFTILLNNFREVRKSGEEINVGTWGGACPNVPLVATPLSGITAVGLLEQSFNRLSSCGRAINAG